MHLQTQSGLKPGHGAHANHEHHWDVFGTALYEVSLLLQCMDCGAVGSVDDPSSEEWDLACDAPSTPYRWHEGARVRIRD